MEANRRSDYATNADAGRGPSKPRALVFEQSVTSELSTFFPFDSYKLPRSGSYIRGVYREWSSVAIDDENEEEEEDDEDEAGDEEDGEEAASQPVGTMINGARAPSQVSDDTDGLGESFGGISISPARPGHTPQVLVV